MIQGMQLTVLMYGSRASHPSDLSLLNIYDRNSSCGKVMFSQACVCSQVTGGYAWSEVPLGVGMPNPKSGPRSLLGGGWVCPAQVGMWICPGGGYV